MPLAIGCQGNGMARVDEQVLKLISDKEVTKRNNQNNSEIELGYRYPSLLRLTMTGSFQAIGRIKAIRPWRAMKT